MTGSLTRRSVLLASAAGLTACGGTEAAPPRQPSSTSTATTATRRRRRRAAPVSPLVLAIPALGLTTSLITLGLKQDDTVEVPSDPDRAGWFRPGTVPGRHGSSVILGHVDSEAGPAVFAELATLRPGDRVDVTLSDETTVAFEVERVATFANADFPAQEVYAAPGRASRLNLVTCGGAYDRDRGGYQANVVVFTRRV